MPASPSPIPGLVGRTETALGALLAPLLADAGLTFTQWVVLTLTATAAETAEDGDAGAGRDRLIADAVAARGFAPADVAAAIGDLQAAGALADGQGPLLLTGSGQAAYARLRSRLAGTTAYLFDQPAEDLAAASRVLATVTARAAEVLAAR